MGERRRFCHKEYLSPQGGTAKLIRKHIVFCYAIERIGCVAYRLALPKNLAVHPVFHVSLLHTYRSNGTCQPRLHSESFQWDGEAHWIVKGSFGVNGAVAKANLSCLTWCIGEGFPSENDMLEPEAYFGELLSSSCRVCRSRSCCGWSCGPIFDPQSS